MKRYLMLLAVVGCVLAEEAAKEEKTIVAADEDVAVRLDPLTFLAGNAGLFAILKALFEIAMQIVIMVALSLLLGTLHPYVENYFAEDNYYDYYGGTGYSNGYSSDYSYDVGASGGSSYASTAHGVVKRAVDSPIVQQLTNQVYAAFDAFSH